METPPDCSATERFQRADAVFDAALDLPPGEQAAYVEHACAGDPVLRADVERLLAGPQPVRGFSHYASGESSGAADGPVRDA